MASSAAASFRVNRLAVRIKASGRAAGGVRFRSAAAGRSLRIAGEISRDCPVAQVLVDLVDAAIEHVPDALRGKCFLARPQQLPVWESAAAWRPDRVVRALAEQACAELCRDGGGPLLRMEPARFERGSPLAENTVLLIEERAFAHHDAVDTLESLHGSLSGRNAVVLIGRTRVETWEQLLLGLSPDWWAAGPAGNASPLRSFTQWESMARAAGFGDVVAFPRDASRRAAASLGLFLLFPDADVSAANGKSHAEP